MALTKPPLPPALPRQSVEDMRRRVAAVRSGKLATISSDKLIAKLRPRQS